LDWIEQSIATSEGTEYVVFIDALSRTGQGSSDDFELRWNNAVFATVTTAEMQGQSWQTFGGIVTGTGSSDALRIAETAESNDGRGPVIDNVRAYRATAPSVNEQMPGGTAVTHIHVSTLDGSSFSNLRLADDAEGRFALDTETGLITTTRSLDYDSEPSSYRLTVAVDTSEGTHLQYVNIALNETNQGPGAVNLVNTVSTLAEDADTSSRTRVADIEITDDGAGTNTVSLAGADASRFEVVGSELHLKAGTPLNYEAQASYSVTVQVADQSVAPARPVEVDFSLLVDELGEILDSLESDWRETIDLEHTGLDEVDELLWSA